jgi:hypothetical protein
MPTDVFALTRRQAEDRAHFTHDAYIYKREGVRKGKMLGYWEQEGYARQEPDGSFYIYLHSTPIGGFDGRIKCYEYGTGPTEDAEPELTGEELPGEADDES